MRFILSISITVVGILGCSPSGEQLPGGLSSSSISEIPLAVSANPAGGSFSGPQNIFLFATDPTARIFFSTNTTPTQDDSFLYQKGAAITLAQNTTLNFFSTNETGDKTDIVTEVYKIDVFNPLISFLGSIPSVTNKTVVLKIDTSQLDPSDVIKFTQDDVNKDIKSEGADYNTSTGIVLIANSGEEKPFVIRAQAFDTDGRGSNILQHTVVIDKIEPSVTFSHDSKTFNQNPVVTITSDDALFMHFTKEVGQEVSSPTLGSPKIQSGAAIKIEETNTVLKVFAVDEAGNGKFFASESFTLEGQKKQAAEDVSVRIASISPANFGPHNANTNFSILCKKDGNINSSANSFFAVNQLAQVQGPSVGFINTGNLPKNQKFTLHVLCNDGNFQTRNSREFLIDTLPPELILLPQPSSLTNKQFSNNVNMSIDIVNRQPGDLAFVTVNNFAEKQIAGGGVTLTTTSTVRIRLMDAAGNQSLLGPFRYDIASDKDNDGIADNLDPCPDHPNVQTDSASLVDTDGDGIFDVCDNCTHTANAVRIPGGLNKVINGSDFDKDGVGDACDTCKTIANGPILGSANQLINRQAGINSFGQPIITKFNDGECDAGKLPMGFCGASCKEAYCQPTAANSSLFPPLAGDDTDNDGIRNICDFRIIDGVIVQTDKDHDHDGFQEGCTQEKNSFCDNCFNKSNPDQIDSDGDGAGDACDGENGEFALDTDNDGFPEFHKLTARNQAVRACTRGRVKSDFTVTRPEKVSVNGALKECDSCKNNADTTDSDKDGIHDCGEVELGASLKFDSDQDGLDDVLGSAGRGIGIDKCKQCGNTEATLCAVHATSIADRISNDDKDNDTIGDACDNCPNLSNRDQLDSNRNGIGDECEVFQFQGMGGNPKITRHYPLAIVWHTYSAFKGVSNRALKHYEVLVRDATNNREIFKQVFPPASSYILKDYWEDLYSKDYEIIVRAVHENGSKTEKKLPYQFEFDSTVQTGQNLNRQIDVISSQNRFWVAPAWNVHRKMDQGTILTNVWDNKEFIRYDNDNSSVSYKFTRPVNVKKIYFRQPFSSSLHHFQVGKVCAGKYYTYNTFRTAKIELTGPRKMLQDRPTETETHITATAHLMAPETARFNFYRITNSAALETPKRINFFPCPKIYGVLGCPSWNSNLPASSELALFEVDLAKLGIHNALGITEVKISGVPYTCQTRDSQNRLVNCHQYRINPPAIDHELINQKYIVNNGAGQEDLAHRCMANQVPVQVGVKSNRPMTNQIEVHGEIYKFSHEPNF